MSFVGQQNGNSNLVSLAILDLQFLFLKALILSDSVERLKWWTRENDSARLDFQIQFSTLL